MQLPLRYNRGFSLAELIVCGAIASMGFIFAAPALNKGRDGVDRLRCENNLRQLSQAHLMYANARGGLPPMAMSFSNAHYNANQPGPGGWFDGHGWYSFVGPYIGEPAWASSINMAVSLSSPVNAEMRRGGLWLKVYACPAGIGLQRSEWSSNIWARTLVNYVVNAGNTNYGQTDIAAGGATTPFLGAPFTYEQLTPLSTISDGLSDTLMMSEVLVLTGTTQWGGPYSDIQSSIGGQVFTGFDPPNNANRNDDIGYGRNGQLSQSAADARYLAAGFTPDNWPTSSGPPYNAHIAARSKHPGGVNVSLCDGSAGFITDAIDPTVWRALSTARGGDFVPPTQSASPSAAKKGAK